MSTGMQTKGGAFTGDDKDFLRFTLGKGQVPALHCGGGTGGAGFHDKGGQTRVWRRCRHGLACICARR